MCATGRVCPVAVSEQSSPPLVCLEKPLCCPSLSLFFFFYLSHVLCHDAASEHVSALKTNQQASGESDHVHSDLIVCSVRIMCAVERETNHSVPLFSFSIGHLGLHHWPFITDESLDPPEDTKQIYFLTWLRCYLCK